ncbi:hypothetical protein [Hymenobacter wooponensis]|uniref:Secreted protein n=1 Tax=Hymenobacter wooponensis TaxID=1525360 RepID=A0A4Z0MSW8_9BACT|nr:hypothetical protein [Hymenobacter wooponensis]TGD82704.1 hypothetical protein EU557_02670 [Hymenobacter wooponensis]
MKLPKHLISGSLLLLVPAAMSCSIFQSGSSSSGGTTSGSMASYDSQQIETLRSEISEQERVTKEAKLRAKSEEERLSAKKHQLKAAEREQKANQIGSGS